MVPGTDAPEVEYVPALFQSHRERPVHIQRLHADGALARQRSATHQHDLKGRHCRGSWVSTMLKTFVQVPRQDKQPVRTVANVKGDAHEHRQLKQRHQKMRRTVHQDDGTYFATNQL